MSHVWCNIPGGYEKKAGVVRSGLAGNEVKIGFSPSSLIVLVATLHWHTSGSLALFIRMMGNGEVIAQSAMLAGYVSHDTHAPLIRDCTMASATNTLFLPFCRGRRWIFVGFWPLSGCNNLGWSSAVERIGPVACILEDEDGNIGAWRRAKKEEGSRKDPERFRVRVAVA